MRGKQIRFKNRIKICVIQNAVFQNGNNHRTSSTGAQSTTTTFTYPGAQYDVRIATTSHLSHIKFK